ncbi:MAG: HYR domain-containing protein, partial [Pyrinomonadaceae bacterium]
LTTGNPVSYEILVTNNGPDTASSVELTDAVPTNLTYVSSSQDSGPTFTQDAETPSTTWSIASLPAGASARFTITYTVDAAAGTVISNTANITNTTDETHNDDNTSMTFDVVATGGGAPDCSLDCPNNIVTTATTHGENGGANVTFSAPEAVGTCGTITTTPASGSFFPIGTTTVTSTSATGNGFCSFTVTVVDTDAPTITCPANISVTANSGQGSAFVPDPNGSSSNVGTATVTGDQPLELSESREDGEALTAAYPIGVTEITRVVTDPSGRQATCTQLITVLPNQVLTITCPNDVSANSPTGCDPATVNVGTATSNSATAVITSERSDGLPLTDPYPVGITTIEWTATDTDTQVASCTQTVTVTGTDTTPPTLVVPPNVSVTTSTCTATLDDELGVATAEEPDCGTVSISRTGIPQIACPTPQNPNQTCDSFVFPTGTTIITYTATNSSGLFTVGTQMVTVTEDPAINPTITAPADVDLFTGSGATSCGVTVTNLDATLGTATASDNCPGVTVTRIGVPAGNVFLVGNTTITYRATDRNGNFAEDTQVVTVTDNTAPAITCPANITLEPTCPTGAIATWTAPVGTDNCPGATTTQTAGPASGSVFPIGTTTVTYSVTDAHGNGPVSCSFTVTVLTPQAVVQNLINSVNASSLTGTQKNGLLAKLNAALDAINQGKQNVACNKLSDFVNNVGTLISHGDISAAQGNAWISSANHVRNTIGCTNLPCSGGHSDWP